MLVVARVRHRDKKHQLLNPRCVGILEKIRKMGRQEILVSYLWEAGIEVAT
jgi:hypothetical protein